MNASSILNQQTLEPGRKHKSPKSLPFSPPAFKPFPSPSVSFNVYVFHPTLSLDVLAFNMIISHKALEVLMFTRRLYLVSVGRCQVQILFHRGSCGPQKLCCDPQMQHPVCPNLYWSQWYKNFTGTPVLKILSTPEKIHKHKGLQKIR